MMNIQDPKPPSAFRLQIILDTLAAQPLLTVSEAAAMVGLSTSRFQHVFHDELGTSMRAYKQELKLQQAYKLLEDSTLRVKEVGYLCGIPDPANFTHLFKQRFGITPSTIRDRKKRTPGLAESTNVPIE
jgi:AraC-like DNA-binding protein